MPTPDTAGNLQLSVYAGYPPPTDTDVQQAVARLKANFPRMQPSFFALLAECIIASDMPKQQLTDAVNHLLNTCRYPEIRIADVMQYGANVRFYTGKQFVAMQTEGYQASDFGKIAINGKHFFYLRADVESQRTPVLWAKQPDK